METFFFRPFLQLYENIYQSPIEQNSIHHKLFFLLPSGSQSCSIRTVTARYYKSFFPQTVRALSSLPPKGCSMQHYDPPRNTHTHTRLKKSKGLFKLNSTNTQTEVADIFSTPHLYFVMFVPHDTFCATVICTSMSCQSFYFTLHCIT